MLRKLSLVLAGGFCGAMTRYSLAKPLLTLGSTLHVASNGFPYDILVINLSGAFLIGLLYGAFEHGAPLSPDARLALGTGFLGAYTTFSSFMEGAATLLRDGQTLTAILYLGGSMAAGVTLAYFGFTLAGHAVARQWAWRLTVSDELLVDGGWELAPDEVEDEREALPQMGRSHAFYDAEGSVR